MTYFGGCSCLDDVKKLYHQLVIEFHPDNNLGKDTTVIMQAINAEYTQAFNRLKNVRRAASGETYTASKETNETAADFADIIDKIIHMMNCKIEIIGSWIWVTGNTIEYRSILKSIGFHWHCKKKAWVYHKDPYQKAHKRDYTMDEIRDTYGSKEIKTRPIFFNIAT